MTSVDSCSGTTISNSGLQVTKGNDTGMPHRNETYLEGDERGHTLASSLGGSNDEFNVRPQAKDVNHGSFRRLEEAESSALKNGDHISSERIAYSTYGVGSRPEAYMVNDTITHPNGKTEQFHFSTSNIMLHEMEAFENQADQTPGYWEMVNEFDNPGNTLQESMSVSDYSALMEATDAELPTLREAYEEADFSGLVSGSSSYELPTLTETYEDVDFSELGGDSSSNEPGMDSGTDPGIDPGSDGPDVSEE